MEEWGILHNEYLNNILTNENLNSNNLIPLQNLGNQVFKSENWHTIDNNWEYHDPIKLTQVINSLHINQMSRRAIQQMLLSEDTISNDAFLENMLVLESDLLNNPTENKIALGFFAVLRHSHHFWMSDKNPLKKEKRKVPFRVIVKYDAFGFLTGLVFGGVVYGGYEFFISKSRYDKAGIFLGTGVALVTTVWNSFRWARKYKNKTNESES